MFARARCACRRPASRRPPTSPHGPLRPRGGRSLRERGAGATCGTAAAFAQRASSATPGRVSRAEAPPPAARTAAPAIFARRLPGVCRVRRQRQRPRAHAARDATCCAAGFCCMRWMLRHSASRSVTRSRHRMLSFVASSAMRYSFYMNVLKRAGTRAPTVLALTRGARGVGRARADITRPDSTRRRRGAMRAACSHHCDGMRGERGPWWVRWDPGRGNGRGRGANERRET